MEAIISPDILKWAIHRKNISEFDLAQKVNVKPEQIQLWGTGEAKPTFTQAKTIAKKLNIPFGYLFMTHIPDEKVQIPDLRRIDIKANFELSPDFKDAISDVQRKQYWYRKSLIDEGKDKLHFIGKYNLEDDINEVADYISNLLHINISLRNQVTSWNAYLTQIVKNSEENGIIILRTGIVKNNSHRSLKIDEFRGFALFDEFAPFIFINSKDSIAGRIFTLAHEIAHIIIGKSGISNIDLKNIEFKNEHEIEIFCDKVATELLVPKDEYLSKWKSENSIEDNLYNLVRVFRVSSIVILRRAFNLDLIYKTEFFDNYNKEINKQKNNEKPSGGNSINNIICRNSYTLTNAIINAAFEGRLLFREASQLLNVKVKTLELLSDKFYGE